MPSRSSPCAPASGILGIVVWQVLLLQVEQTPPAAQYFLASGLAIAVATLAFLLPLMGMQHRLASEKARLADSVNSRIEAAMARNHDAMDAGNLAEADQLGKMFATLTQERDLVNHLRTWPWSPGTLNVFVSAIALPIGLWIATRLLGRVL